MTPLRQSGNWQKACTVFAVKNMRNKLLHLDEVRKATVWTVVEPHVASGPSRRGWREIAEEVLNEHDAERLGALLEELLNALEHRTGRESAGNSNLPEN